MWRDSGPEPEPCRSDNRKGLGLRVWDLRFRVWGLGFRILGLEVGGLHKGLGFSDFFNLIPTLPKTLR